MVQTISYAVFRARVLHGMKHFGIHYDDLEICNGQGVYKGGISKLQEQLNQLNNNTNTNSEIKRTIKEDEVIVYPNPATNYVTISCKNAKQVIISDLLGHKISDNKLDSKVLENKIQLNNISPGVYFYKVFKLYNSVYTGKLIIE
jgi:hypothetical protein